MEITEGFDNGKNVPFVRLDGVRHFDAARTFTCGQCFRFDDGGDGIYYGTAFGKAIGVSYTDGVLTVYNSTAREYDALWNKFLGLDEDYDIINNDISEHFRPYGDTIDKAVSTGDGIRILRQDTWEALCSFIISQNNNIPRIKKIIAALSQGLGNEINAFGRTFYTFPTPESLINIGIDGIAAYRTGFRAKYIYDAACRYSAGEIDVKELSGMKDAEVCEKLMSISGVGPKVASCVMLYGMHRTASFPIDVWIKRVIAKYYPDGLDIEKLGNYAGIAQQYLFYYERSVSV